MGRVKNRSESSYIYQMYVIGEQIRCQMLFQGFIKDRRYHLRKHRKCFVGKDTVDWLVRMCHVQSRDEAVRAMQVLKEIGFIRHVTDEHDFKDQNTFYRFTRDDDTYRATKDLASFYRGMEIHERLSKTGQDVLRDVYHKGSLYAKCFHGCDVIDFLQAMEGTLDRDCHIFEMRELLEKGIIKHVTDDYAFSDDHLIYEFSFDFHQPHMLLDALEVMDEWKHSLRKAAGSKPGVTPLSTHNGHDNEQQECVSISTSLRQELDQEDDSDSDELDERDGVNLSGITRETQGRPSLSAHQQVTLMPDTVGFGFVIHGSSPCRVQRVDPLGPAAKAGIKPHHCVCSINGHDVSAMSHLQVRQLLQHSRCQGDVLQLTLTPPRSRSHRSSRDP